MNIDCYILLDKQYQPIYKTFDLRDLATKILILNEELSYINSHIRYENRKLFDYKLIIEKHRIEELDDKRIRKE